MAEEEPIVNGVSSEPIEDNQTVENEAKSKFAAFEEEKAQLIDENEKNEEKIKLLMDEIDGLKIDRVEMKKRLDGRLDEKQKQIDQHEQDKRALEAISTRAASLETEVARLQHDLISSMSENEDTIKELIEVKGAFEGLKSSEKAKSEKIESLSKEKDDLVEKLGAATVANEAKENRIQELEKIVSEFEARVSSKESEIVALKKKKNEKEAEVIALQDHVKKSDSKAEAMEAELEELRSKVEEYKQNNLMNVVVRDESGKESTERGLNGYKFQWPAALASTGTVAIAAAAVYMGYARRR